MGILFAAFNLLQEKMEAGQTPVIMTHCFLCVFTPGASWKLWFYGHVPQPPLTVSNALLTGWLTGVGLSI